MANTQAGWYPDPENASISRWWDGQRWTDRRPDPYSTSVPSAQLAAPGGTSPYTVWIWLIVVLLVLPPFGLLLMDWAGIVASAVAVPSGAGNLAMLSDPGFLITTLSGWVSLGLCVLFAYFDWRELQRRGVPRPFHFAWVLLYIITYTIGRSVVVRRRTGRGIAPMWVSIAGMVASFAIGIYLGVMMVIGVIEALLATQYGS
jgi:Protein of unknown function (DUF2510)